MGKIQDAMHYVEDNIELGFKSAWDKQVGGDHYTKLKIQPMRYSMENNLDPCQHTAIKYITRFKDKDGRKDLQKARDCIDMLEEYYYGSETG